MSEKIEIKKEAIQEVYQQLKNRAIHPSGEFDNGGRWYSSNQDLISVRTPSRAWPYSEMTACRTKKYVGKVWEKFGCKTKAELAANI
tara:strand:- start:272 stop:532 length:261 start_codon:yes stop_codon:yes gene_type:complete